MTDFIHELKKRFTQQIIHIYINIYEYLYL